MRITARPSILRWRPQLRRAPWDLVVAGALASQIVMLVLIATRSVEIGSVRGGWVYPYRDTVDVRTVLAAVVASLAAVGLARLGTALIDRWEILVVGGCLVLGAALQLLVPGHGLAAVSALVRSDASNGFYTNARALGPGDLLGDFVGAARSSPSLHVRANMPGKTLLYEGLLALSERPAALGVAVGALSAVVGGGLAYVVARLLFGARTTALYALLFFLALPSRLVMLPTLNVVTPVLALTLFAGGLVLLRWPRLWNALLIGVVAYLAVLFEPTTLVAGVLFVPFAARALLDRTVHPGQAVRLVLAAGAGFALVHMTMQVLWGFDIVNAVRYVLEDARAFNRTTGRPWTTWVAANPLEFSIACGLGVVVPVLAVALGTGIAVVGRPRANRRLLMDSAAALSLAIAAVLLAVDLTGVSRGEVTRLWTFMGAFLTIAAAGVSCRSGGRSTCDLLLALTVIQGVVLAATVRYVGVSFEPVAAPPGATALGIHGNTVLASVLLVVVLAGGALTLRRIAPREGAVTPHR